MNKPNPKNKKLKISLMFLFLLIGIALRTFNFSDLLIFKADQARDAIIISDSIEKGFSTLPLLGPQVGGTPFRLGPASYYFQFISGKIFGAKPESYAYPDLLWGILTLPILYFLFRKFFSFSISLWLFALSSVSIFLVTFSRFAWNPNGLPFFTSLFLFLFLKIIERKKGERWQIIIFLSLIIGIIAQLHFAAGAGILFGIISFSVFYRNFSWKEIGLSALIIIFTHFPLLISEWKTQGNNIKEFKTAFIRKEAIGEKHNILEKTFRAYQENARILWLTLSGQTKFDPILTRGFSIKCDKECKNKLPENIFSIILLSLVPYIYLKKYKETNDSKEKNIFAFLGLWLVSFFIITIFLAYQLEVRFYLGIIPLVFIFIGFLIEKIITTNKYFNHIILTIGIIIIGINLKSTLSYLNDLSKTKNSLEETGYDLRFGSDQKVTLGQLRAMGEKISKELPLEFPVIINGETLHVRSLFYVISYEKKYKSCYLRGTSNEIPQSLNNVLIEKNNPNNPKNLRENEYFFGTLNIRINKATIDYSENDFIKTCPSAY